jgi:hypothetical protein
MRTFPLSQSDLALLLSLAWHSYLDNQPQFVDYKHREMLALTAGGLVMLNGAGYPQH